MVIGLKTFLEDIDIEPLNAPTLYTFEFKHEARLKIDRRIKTCRNFINRSYLDMKFVIGFKNLTPPSVLTTIRCALSNFLDYSPQSTKIVKINDINFILLLKKESLISLKSTVQKVILPTFYFSLS